MIKKLFIFSFCCLGFTSSLGESRPPTDNEINQPVKALTLENRLAFARELEKQKDFYRAITEYKRQLFKYPNKATQRACHLGIVRCYYEGHKWPALNEACHQALKLNVFTDAEKNSLHKVKALALWNLGKSDAAYKQVVDLKDTHKNASQLKAWTAFSLGKKEEAKKYFLKADQNNYAATLEEYNQHHKSPALAGTLSAFIPGAGQLYCGQHSAALGAFLLNGLLIAATVEAFDEDHEVLGSGLALLSSGFYMGNIYGAVNFAHQYNNQKKDDWLARKSHLAGKYKESVILKIDLPF